MRIAYLPDSFHEVNGVAHTSRNFAAYAQRRGIEMLCIRAGAPQNTAKGAHLDAEAWEPSGVMHGQHGTLRTLDLRRSRIAIGIEKDLSFDPLFFRHGRAIESFRPDVVHITLLVRIARELEQLGVDNVRFRIVGHGSEEAMLRRELPNADFPGVLRGEALAAAYADMDLFVFPSHTDTFGNVVLEALASGVPAIVTSSGGPRFIVREGVTGLISSDDGFPSAIATLAADRDPLARMCRAARAHALTCSWDAVFDSVVSDYPGVRAAPVPVALDTAV